MTNQQPTKKNPHGGIAWTDFTSNPIRYRNAAGAVVWGCSKVSAGCTHCYAEALAKRFNRGAAFNDAEMAKLSTFVDEDELRTLLTSKKIAGKRVFIGDMTDVFGSWVSDALLDQLFAVFALRQDVTFQLLTKRPGRMREYLDGDWMPARARWINVLSGWCKLSDVQQVTSRKRESAFSKFINAHGWPALNPEHGWPLPNVWLGTSVEDQASADTRISDLLNTTAVVRFVSYEPALGPVDFTDIAWPINRHRFPSTDDISDARSCLRVVEGTRIDWVIVGGESGHGARPFDLGWARSAVKQCQSAGIACFVKQLGSTCGEYAYPSNVTDTERQLWGDDGWTRVISRDGEMFAKYTRLKSRAGSDPSEWPDDLRVREFPVVPA